MAASTRVGYAIQTHAHPEQIERLVHTLVRHDPTGFVHLSHDRKGAQLPDSLLQHPSVQVSLDEGGRGRFHNVDRWLGAARWFRDHEEIDYLVTLTGQDYPVRPLEELHAALVESGDGLMEYFPVLREGGNWPLYEGRSRYLYSWHEVRRLSPKAKNRLRPLLALNFVQPLVRVNVAYDSLRLATRTRHPFPPGWEPWGGSFFTNLSWRAVEHVLAASEDQQLMTWARRSLLIEEAFFQTLLLNPGTFTFVNSSGRYYDFAGAQHGSPATLGVGDVPKALASQQFFARKWDPKGGDELYGQLDEALVV
jgi:hypothetical protein